MPPRMTNMQAEAYEAFSPILASAGALVFVNAYAGSAAASAPYHAFAEHQLACPLAPLSHTLGDHPCSTKRPKHLRPLSASTGRMPHMMCVDKRRAPRHESTASSHTRQKPWRRGWVPCASGSQAHRSPSASNSTKVPWSPPGARMTFWCSFPSSR